MEERSHWNKIGSGYQDEIFDVFQSDRLKIIPKIIAKHANPEHTAIDFGCGTGRAFEYLSPSFKSVFAVDISDNLLAIAKQSGFNNITFKQHDLTKPLKASADFGFCCNVVMLPEVELNRKMLKNIRQSIKGGGSVAIVMPSLESFFYSGWRLIEWCKKQKEDVDASDLSGFKGSKRDLIEGIVRIDNVKTKHYLESELVVLFTEAGFKNITITKVEYDWTSEFTSPPKWMKEPYPWDWIIEARSLTDHTDSTEKMH
ncbi:MAG: class I SAM-dependent methyltransferase [Bacteroidota bacterium]